MRQLEGHNLWGSGGEWWGKGWERGHLWMGVGAWRLGADLAEAASTWKDIISPEVPD